MNQSNAAPAADGLGVCAWLGFWGQIGVLALFAVLGAFYASADAAPGDEVCGLALSLAALALAFLRLKARFDGAVVGWAGLFVDDMPNLAAIIVVCVVLGLAGLFVAAGFDQGGLHDAGVALALASALLALLSIKNVFDTIERRH